MGRVKDLGSLVALVLVALSQPVAGMQVFLDELQIQKAKEMVGLLDQAKAQSTADQLWTTMGRASTVHVDQVASVGKRLETFGSEKRRLMEQFMGPGFRPENIIDADRAFAQTAVEKSTMARPALMDKVQVVSEAAREDPEMGELAAQLGKYVAAASKEVTQMTHNNLEEALPHIAEFTQRLQRDLETGSQRPLVESLIQKVARVVPARFNERELQGLEADQSAQTCTEELLDVLATCEKLEDFREQSCIAARAACEKEGRLFGTKMNISWDLAPAVAVGQWVRFGKSGFSWEVRLSPKFGGMMYKEGMLAGNDPYYLRAGMRNKVDIGWQFSDGTKIFAGSLPAFVCEKGKKECSYKGKTRSFAGIRTESESGRMISGKFDRKADTNRLIGGLWFPWEAYNRSNPDDKTHDTYVKAYAQPGVLFDNDLTEVFVGGQGGKLWMDEDWSDSTNWWSQFTLVKEHWKDDLHGSGMLGFDTWGWSLEGRFTWKSADFWSKQLIPWYGKSDTETPDSEEIPEMNNIPSTMNNMGSSVDASAP